jgi:hypothetical protein
LKEEKEEGLGLSIPFKNEKGRILLPYKIPNLSNSSIPPT